MRLFSLLTFLLATALPVASAQVSSFGGFGATASAGPATSELTGMAFSGVALPSDGPGSFLLNPARLASVESGISASLLARPLSLEADFVGSDIFYGAQALTAGFYSPSTTWRFGVGLGRSVFNLGEQIATDAAGNESGTFDTAIGSLVLGAAALYEGPVVLSVGVATRRVSEPVFSLEVSDDIGFENRSAWGVDLGVQGVLPIVRPSAQGGYSVHVGIGYALQSLGGDVTIGSQGVSPLAARSRLGWSASLGYDTERSGRLVRAVQVDVALEASHALARQESSGLSDPPGDPSPIAQRPTYRVAAPLGRIRPLDALLGRSRGAAGSPYDADPSGYRAAVIGHRGVRVEVLEAFQARFGMHGSPFDPTEQTTYGMGAGISLAGLFRLLDPAGELGALAERGDVQLSYARYTYFVDRAVEDGASQPWSIGATLSMRWP